MHALRKYVNIAQPGSYNTEINKLLKANKLPNVIVPDNPPSLEIMNTAQAKLNETEPSVNTQDNNQEQVEEIKQRRKTEQMRKQQQQQGKKHRQTSK